MLTGVFLNLPFFHKTAALFSDEEFFECEGAEEEHEVNHEKM